MIGILTEKPSALRNFSKALGGNTGSYNGEAYVLVAARGHLYAYKEPHEQVPPAMVEEFKKWNLDYLPWDENQIAWEREVPPIITKSSSGKYIRKVDKDKQALLRDIQKTLMKCDEIVIASDVDPTGEGSLLAWEIIDGLNLRPKKFSRMYFVDEAVKSIQDAFVKRKPLKGMLDDPDYLKGSYRSKWDFLSMQWTRIATNSGDGKTMLRQGRLKSAMVLLTGDGLKAVNNYQKVPFYENRFKDENGVVYTWADEPRYPKKTDVPNSYRASAVVQDGIDAKRTAPPKLIDLAGLSGLLAGKGVKAKDVLSVYQKMYEAQIVSYPRTEDKVITPEQFNELLPLADKIAKVVGVDPKLLTHKKPRATHVKTGAAHGANRPGTNVPASLGALSSYGSIAPMIYEILAKNYLAILGADYEYEIHRGHVKDYPKFTGTAHVPKVMGFKDIFSDDDDDDTITSATGLGKMAQPFVHEGFPPKPPTPTMKWLMRQLEKYDVGTGATRTSTFAEVSNGKPTALLAESRGKLSFTKPGEMSYLLLPGTYIGDLKTTERLQQDMKRIEKGELTEAKGLAEVADLIRHDIQVMQKNGATMRKELGVSMSNTNYSADYVEGRWKGKDVKFKKVVRGYELTDDEIETLLDGKEVDFEFTSKEGKPYKMTGKLANLEYNGRKYVGVDLQFAARDSVPDEWCGHKFTAAEKKALENGESVYIAEATSRKGSKFSCNVSYGVNDKGFKGIIPEFN